MKSREILIDYLLSEEYIDLLARAVLYRVCTTFNCNRTKHFKAAELIGNYRSEKKQQESNDEGMDKS